MVVVESGETNPALHEAVSYASSSMLFSIPTLVAYCSASILLIIAPGPGQALVIARSARSGLRAGLLTSVGLRLGTLVHTIAAALGLSAVLNTSAMAFGIVKYAGAAYLVVLGVWTWKRSMGTPEVVDRTAVVHVPAHARLIVHGVVTGILNPKVALFFLAFLPQFVDPTRGRVLLQFVVLGTILALFGLLSDGILSLLASRVHKRLSGGGRWGVWRERVTGSVLVALGVRLAFVKR